MLDPVGSLVLERMKAADCIVKNATHHLRLTKNGSTRSVDCCVYLTDRSIETISVVRDLVQRRMTMAAGGYQPLDALHNLMALNEGICYSDYCRTLSCCQLLAVGKFPRWVVCSRQPIRRMKKFGQSMDKGGKAGCKRLGRTGRC